MYQIALPQISNSESWYEQFFIVAADDLTPIDADDDGIVMNLQVMSRLPRGFADQSQGYGWGFPNFNGIIGFNPVINISTNDGSGQLSLDGGVLQINIPASTMNLLCAGYYSVSITMKNSDITKQIAIGMMPVYDSGALT